MKGLIVKDLMVAGRQIRTALVIVLFYVVLFWRNASVLVGLMSLMCMMTVVSSFSYDEASRFISYAAALPVARRTIVRAKYALGFGLLALGAGGSALLTMLVGVLAGGLASLEALGAAAGCTLAMGFMLCLTLPLMFRLPVERARVFMTLAMIVPTLLIVTLMQVADVPLAALERAPWPLLLAGMALLLAVCAAASYRIAVRFVQQRDL
ncbi:MAG TPA: ABC-2 transporter permease [Candidatus Onthenecus intestinigallinarum]|uniref:ABC-2 transporter permease n=1 Tax=Candidatus Onthenecus intestinigallinarum TaxID=2840875 RepID=A0A9D0Z9C4_9FIRM|nr:ABC-2 transporter permease [Candidatus Onthenecus intestinigallinarum]